MASDELLLHCGSYCKCKESTERVDYTSSWTQETTHREVIISHLLPTFSTTYTIHSLLIASMEHSQIAD